MNTSMYDASEGANSGAHIALLTKSGTNDLHGQVYEYHQTDAWNAAPFFRNADPSLPPDQKVPKLHRNQFGATLGGPIKKDKSFFFGSYQGVRVTDELGGNSNVTVPLGLTNDRTDPGIVNAVNNSFGCGTPGGTCITANQIDPIARKLLNAKAKNGTFLIPSAQLNAATAIALGHDAVVVGPPATFQADQANGNVDYNFNTKDRFSAKYYYQRDPGTNPFATTQLLDSPQELKAGSQVVSLLNSTFLTPNLSWQQKIGFIREVAFADTKQALTPADVGINVLGNKLFPLINIFNSDPTVRSSLAVGPSSNFANAGVFQNQFGGDSSMSWVRGRQTISFGGSFERTQLNIINENNQLSFIDFGDFPSFVTGTLQNGPGNSTFFNGASNRYYRANQYGVFGNDNFKLKQNLSVSLGFRYDYDGPLVEKNGFLTNFIPSQYKYDFTADAVVSTGLVVAGNNKAFGTKGVSSSTLLHRQQAFEPRIGVVWSPSFIKNFVVRAGFGIYADRGEFFAELSPSAGSDFNGPFGVTLAPPFTIRVFAAPGAPFSAPFGTTPPPPPPSTLAGVNALVLNRPTLATGAAPFVFSGYDVNNKLPYSENWTLDFQWQPVNTLAFMLAYVGNHGVHGTIPIPFNEPRIATQANPFNGETFSYGYQIPGIPQETANTFDGGNIDFRTPFIGYSVNSELYKAAGNSNYDALQFGVNKRLSHGLLVNGSYTWSHALDMQSGLGLFFTGNDPLNLKSAYGNSDFDRTHVLTVSYLYELPKPIRGEGIASKIVNGWGISGITVLESGQPYSVSDFSGAIAGIYFNNFDAITNPIVSYAPGQNAHTAQLQGTTGVNAGMPVLNPSAFTYSPLAPGTSGVPPCTPGPNPVCDNVETGFGNVGRNTFRGPFQERFDFAVNKDTKLTERFRLKYTAQIFNIFNHPSFDTPNNNVFFNQNFNSSQPPILIPGAPPGGSLGFIQHTIGSPRFIQMALHLTF